MNTKEFVATELFLLSIACEKFPVIITDEIIDRICSEREKEIRSGIPNPSIKELLEKITDREWRKIE